MIESLPYCCQLSLNEGKIDVHTLDHIPTCGRAITARIYISILSDGEEKRENERRREREKLLILIINIVYSLENE